VHSGPIIVSTFGVFLKPLSQEFGWSRTQISLAVSLATLAVTGTIPLIGRLVDRLGSRLVIVPSAPLFGLGLMSLYFLTASLWHYYAISLFMAIVGSGTTLVPYSKVISH
jgi:MFS family permease